MEILNTTAHLLEYWFFITLAGVFLLLFGSLMCVGLSKMIKEKDYREDLGATIACTVISLIIVTSLVITFKEGVRITYDVKVSDWNEVYDQGYVIVKQKGEIVTVEQKR